MSVPINLNGIDQLTLNLAGTVTASTAGGDTTINQTITASDIANVADLTVPNTFTAANTFDDLVTLNNALVVNAGNIIVNGGDISTAATGTAQAGHFEGALGATPSVTAGTVLGTGGTAALTAGGTDARGSVTVVTGTTPAAGPGAVCTVTFSAVYANAPTVLLTIGDVSGANLNAVQFTVPQSSTTTAGFQIWIMTGATLPASNPGIIINYWVIG